VISVETVIRERFFQSCYLKLSRHQRIDLYEIADGCYDVVLLTLPTYFDEEKVAQKSPHCKG